MVHVRTTFWKRQRYIEKKSTIPRKTNVKKCKVRRRSSASFPDFTRPKTALQLGTEHGLTSEFGTGSGGTHALWPASAVITQAEPYIPLAHEI